MLSLEVQQIASRSVLCWLATVDPAGHPTVSPKEIWAVIDATRLVIANIASPKSARNIEATPSVCVSFIDVFSQKGFKVLGSARNVKKSEAEFTALSVPLEEKAGSRFPLHSVLVVTATRVEAILAPSYRLYPEATTEQSQIESAMRTYGVRPARGDA
jgi:predicted pyridoxine 5'-phosphate oxidase superfamily flavin-nucleotide-binding protein